MWLVYPCIWFVIVCLYSSICPQTWTVISFFYLGFLIPTLLLSCRYLDRKTSPINFTRESCRPRCGPALWASLIAVGMLPPVTPRQEVSTCHILGWLCFHVHLLILFLFAYFLGAVLGFELRAYEALHRYSLNLSPSCILWEKICSSLTRESVISVLLASSFVFLTDPYMTTQWNGQF
jgi:hypothetical protein